MNAEFPSMAEVMSRHADWVSEGARLCSCFWTDGSLNAQASRLTWAKHVESEWREACTIRTAEQLDALPEQSVVRNMAFGVAFECEVENDGSIIWASPGGLRVTAVMLPALLIWHPGWVKP